MKARSVDVQRGLRDWEWLYSPPPPEKERPTVESGPENTHTGNCEADITPTIEDRQREALARDAFRRFCAASDSETRRDQLRRMNALVLGRSQSAIRSLERQRGLA